MTTSSPESTAASGDSARAEAPHSAAEPRMLRRILPLVALPGVLVGLISLIGGRAGGVTPGRG